MTWQKLSTKQLLSHSRIKVFEDKVRLPNGHVTDYIHFGTGYGAATIFALDNDGKLLVQKEYSYPPDKVLYQLPGGGIAANETPLEAAKRELSEEANLTGNFEEIGWFYIDNRRKPDKMHVFLATELRELKGRKDPEEELEDFWLSEQEIDTLVKNNEFTTYSGLAAWSIYKSRADRHTS